MLYGGCILVAYIVYRAVHMGSLGLILEVGLGIIAVIFTVRHYQRELAQQAAWYQYMLGQYDEYAHPGHPLELTGGQGYDPNQPEPYYPDQYYGGQPNHYGGQPHTGPYGHDPNYGPPHQHGWPQGGHGPNHYQ